MKHDYFHCENMKCPQASICRRSTIHYSKRPGEHWIYSKFAPDKKTGICVYFWSLDTIELDNDQETHK